MSNVVLRCPACGVPAPPRIGITNPYSTVDRYQCDGCGLMTLRDELVVDRVFDVLRGGGAPQAALAVSSILTASMVDPGQATTQLSTASFSVAPGETIVACVSAWLTTGAALDFGAYTANLAVADAGAGSIKTSVWYANINAPGTCIVTATFSGLNAASCVITVSRVTGLIARVHDATAADDSGASQNTAASSGPTAALVSSREIAIGIVGAQLSSSTTPAVIALPLVATQRDGTNSFPADDSVATEARLMVTGNAPLTLSATLPSAAFWGAAVATFR